MQKQIKKLGLYIFFLSLFYVPEMAGAQMRAIYREGWIDMNKNGKKDIYEDQHKPIVERVKDLLSQMNLDEKAGQLTTLYGYGAVLKDSLPTPEWKNEVWVHGIANIDEQLTGLRKSLKYALPYSAHADAINKIQEFFVEDTRLGIPVDFTNEGLAGLNHAKATFFPREIGLGSTFDVSLAGEIGRIEGREAKALGYTNIYAPEVDVASDPRWGRVTSCFSSSPFVIAKLGTAMTQGIQSEGVASTLKHFAVYSIPVGGRDGGVRTHPMVAPREMTEIYLYPFKKIIENAHPLGVMASYNDYDGIPVITDKAFMTDTLRDRFGFNGYVVSDSRAVEFVYQKHHVAADYEDAIKQVLEAGLNVRTDFTQPLEYINPLIDAVKKGNIPMSVIDQRVSEVLNVKFLLGLFDHPYVQDPALADKIVHNEEAKSVALKAAHESIVLLKNENNILPLDKDRIKKIAVIGPNANEITGLMSRYGSVNADLVTVLQGIKNEMGEGNTLYSKGINHTDPHWPQSDVEDFPLNEDEKNQIKEAVDLAEQSDVVVLVVGDNPKTVGESHSRLSIDLPGHQEELVREVAATKKPVILVLANGRPLSINWESDNIPAILETWYLGESTGTAIADVIFGKYNPGGKLAMPFPKSAGQSILTFPTKPADEGSGSARVKGFLYPFGFGLSYTRFNYSDLQIFPENPKVGEDIKVSFVVTNTGKRMGDAVPQLYIHDDVSSVITHERKLRGFDRLTLSPGESKTVTFSVTPEDLSVLDKEMKFTEEPGVFQVMIGESSEDIKLQAGFNVHEAR